MTGGHNLDALATKIETRTSVAPGRVVITSDADGTRVIRVNPADAEAAGPLARVYARNAEDPAVTAKLEQTMAKQAKQAGAPREVHAALAFERSKVSGRGLSDTEAQGFIFDGRSFRTAPEAYTPERFTLMRELAERLRYDLVVERVDDGYVIFRAVPPEVIRAHTTPALVELLEGQAGLVARQHQPRIVFRDFAGHEVESLVGSTELRALSLQNRRSRLISGGGQPPREPPTRPTLAAGSPDEPGPSYIYLRYGEDGKARQLRLSRRQPQERAEAEKALNLELAIDRIARQPDWSNAKIQRVTFDHSLAATGKYSGHYRLDFEVTIPVTVPATPSLPLRIAAFVKRLLVSCPRDNVHIWVPGDMLFLVAGGLAWVGHASRRSC